MGTRVWTVTLYWTIEYESLDRDLVLILILQVSLGRDPQAEILAAS